MAGYIRLEPKSFEMEFEGEQIDLLSVGVAQISLQRIAEKVSHDMLTTEGLLAPGWKWSGYPSRWFQPEYPKLVQTEITKAGTGSFYSVLEFAVVSTLSDPHVMAILDNLAANVIWAISTSGLRGISSELSDRLPILRRFRRQEKDPYGVETFVRDTILVAEQNPSIKAIKYRVSQSEVVLDLEFYRRTERMERAE